MSDTINTPFRHADLAAELTAEITSGRYAVGEKFPTEQELQARFGIGRHTVREALKMMTEQGLLGRRRKTGTTVLSNRPISQFVHSLRDIHSLLDFAHSTSLAIDHVGFVGILNSASPEHAGLTDGRYLRVAGIRFKVSDGKPLCWAEIMIPERYSLERSELQGGNSPLYELVAKHHGLKLEVVEQEVSAMELPRQLAVKLGAADEVAALLVKRRYYTPMGELFEITNNLYPASRFTVHMTVRQRA